MQQERINKIKEALYKNSASVVKEGILQYVSIEELFELSLHTTERLAFHAAWALEHVLLIQKVILFKNKNQIVSVFAASNNWSVLRSFSKLVMEVQKNKIKHSLVNEDEKEIILNKTFDILENSACPIAVRCNAYDILCYFASTEDWISTELRHRIQLDLEKNNTPALRSRAKKVLNKLERISYS